jgi:hypothetical protein
MTVRRAGGRRTASDAARQFDQASLSGRQQSSLSIRQFRQPAGLHRRRSRGSRRCAARAAGGDLGDHPIAGEAGLVAELDVVPYGERLGELHPLEGSTETPARPARWTEPGDVVVIRYEGPKSKNPLAFKHYHATEKLDLDAMISARVGLREIDGALAAMEAGE